LKAKVSMRVFCAALARLKGAVSGQGTEGAQEEIMTMVPPVGASVEFFGFSKPDKAEDQTLSAYLIATSIMW
jgi:hypothetical protein